jgi:D-alanyl-D-alanine-carboxypeptidase/D-alanyl-D-alanine-endopeptidase
MSLRVVPFCLAAAIACGGAPRPRVPPPPPPDPAPHRTGVTQLIQPLVDAAIVGTIVVGLYDAGKTEVYGFGTGPGGKPPDGSTLFEIGSVTKVYTSLLLADAVQRKEVDLDQPVSELLPPGVTVPTGAAGQGNTPGAPITLRNLAVHNSGLPRLPPSLAAAPPNADPYAKYDEDALYKDLVRTHLDFEPGQRVTYSNYGVGLLGFALGKKLGGGYVTSLMHRVLEPLGLRDTTFAAPRALAARLAQGTDNDLQPVPPWTADALAAAGALRSSVHDQLALIDAELDAAAGGKGTLRRAMALTQEPQLQSADQNEGLGWQIDKDGRYWHNGQTGGFHSYVGFDPKTRRGVVILAATATTLLDGGADVLYRILAGEKAPAPSFPTQDKLAEYTGKYAALGETFTIEAAFPRLYLVAPNEPKTRLVPIGDDKFWIEQLQSVVVFERDAGKVTRLVFVVGGKQISAPRTE